MICCATWEEARVRRQPLRTETFQGYKTIFFESPGSNELSPQGFLVEQDPGWTLNTHFHLQHQFQVVAHGDGTLGRNALSRMSVHYASPEAGYGPIVAGPDGLWYFTLRAMHDVGSWHLPKWREKLRRGLRKRHAMGHVEAITTCHELSMREVIPMDDTGLGAWMLQIPPGAHTHAPVDEGGVGRFYVVGNGAVTLNGRALQRLSLAFVSADEAPPVLEAGPDGVQLLLLQFPRDAIRVSDA